MRNILQRHQHFIAESDRISLFFAGDVVVSGTTICVALEPCRHELSGVVVKSTYNWYWLVDGLIEAGHVLHLANTKAIKQYDGLKHRGDESDARHLTHLLRLGLLPEGHIMPKSERAVRDLARKRMKLVDMRTANILLIETCLAQQTGSYLSCREIKLLTQMDIDSMPIGPVEASGLKANLAHLLQHRGIGASIRTRTWPTSLQLLANAAPLS